LGIYNKVFYMEDIRKIIREAVDSLDEKSKGLWHNIHAKRKRGEKPAKPGDDDYPDKKSWEKASKSESDEPEGASYKVDLDDVASMSSEINKMIDSEEDLPSWVQDKITIAVHNMDAILGYLKTKDIKSLHENWEIPMRLTSKDSEKIQISESMEYHLKNKIPLGRSEFRYGSDKYFDLIDEARKLYEEGVISLNENDEFLVSEDRSEKIKINGKVVYTNCIYEDFDAINEAEYQGKKVKLNKPKRGGSKKFYVYVRNPKTKKIIKVSFGAKSGGGNLAVKLKDPKARKAFADRHNCEQKNDKTKPGYWACRLPRYAKSLGLSGSGTWW
jgi:hypothetical protein